MNLWIRSQNKTILINVKNLLIDEDKKEIYTVEQMAAAIHTVGLGGYNSKERALEVLDEIQNILKPKPRNVILNNQPIISDLVYRPNEEVQIMPLSNVIVYEMPKE